VKNTTRTSVPKAHVENFLLKNRLKNQKRHKNLLPKAHVEKLLQNKIEGKIQCQVFLNTHV
jgi:hypothetical protein